MAELLKVLYRNDQDGFESIECTAIEVYGNNMAFSNEEQDLIRKDGKVLEVPLANLHHVGPNKKRK